MPNCPMDVFDHRLYIALQRQRRRSGDFSQISGMLHDDRFFPADPATRDIARNLFRSIRKLPLISPHGHTEPQWYAENRSFPDPAQLLIVPDHYVTRMKTLARA